ncbi:dihydrofolate reductase family protein [Frankia sp. AgB32]|uniref:RibD family protein n=1 Tax=Frankia sp. AgB32 TaxID=631119 RepID=UPI00200F3B9D|nr:dihydrofolate reductase family protein [Frankia sp. AgB32]MCK9894987.1 dihydrofolate reductase family protein [Frankia sp. AgB32]
MIGRVETGPRAVGGGRPAARRPYVIGSCAMSLDGRIDDAAAARLILSGPADLDRVDEVRAGCDAILVGAATVRRDDPRLAVRDAGRRAARVAAGLPPSPLKVVLTASGQLAPTARVFAGPGEVVVYRPAPSGAGPAGVGPSGVGPSGVGPVDVGPVGAGGRVVAGGGLTTVVLAGGPRLDVADVLADLAGRGVRRLLVEGGTSVHTAFLTAGLVDELHLVVAPFFVGDPAAPTFVGPGRFPHGVGAPLRLAEVRQLEDAVLLRYLVPVSR